MESVFLVRHVHETSGYEDEKLIGVYRTENDANEAIMRLQSKPGFSETPSRFEIVAYELNKDHWIEGYVTDRGHSAGGETIPAGSGNPQVAA